MASPQPPSQKKSYQLLCSKAFPFQLVAHLLKSIPFQLVAQPQNPKPNPQLTRSGCNTKVELQKRSGCNIKGNGCKTKVELQKGSGCNTKVELQKRSGCNIKGSGCKTKVELQKGSGCNTKVELQKGSGFNTTVELGPKTLHCLDVPKVHPHYFGASIVGGGAFINQVPTLCGSCSRSPSWKIATFKYKNSTRSTFPQQSNLRRATCAEHMRKALARSNWRRATCTEHSRAAACREQLARSSLEQCSLRRPLS